MVYNTNKLIESWDVEINRFLKNRDYINLAVCVVEDEKLFKDGLCSILMNIALQNHLKELDDWTDEQILEFYIREKEANTDQYQRWKHQENLKKSPLFKEAKEWIWACKDDILKGLKWRSIASS